jgi:hypothetical protein
MADLAGCSEGTIVTAVKRIGINGAPRGVQRTQVLLSSLPAEPVCDPDICPYWEDCLDDVDAPCRWPG